ncbi:MAG: cadherin repeat domain-containing protein, partial [Myxococcota bacterium]
MSLPGPLWLSEDEVSVEEDSEAPFYTAEARDPDGDTLRYSVGGSDEALFAIDEVSGELRFLEPPDFENPQGASGSNAYRLVLRASDDDGESTDFALLVIVTNKPPCTTDVDEDGLCAEDDCDDNDAACDAAGCVDADSDGSPACQDPCDDPDDRCQTCEDSDEDGVCADEDCDDTVASCTNDCTTDLDADSQRDCDDT